MNGSSTSSYLERSLYVDLLCIVSIKLSQCWDENSACFLFGRDVC